MLVDFSIYPLGRGESVSPYVARALKIVRRSGLPHRLHAMGTTLEGDWESCLKVVGACFRALKKDCGRIEVVLKADYRRGRSQGLTSKIESVERRLG